MAMTSYERYTTNIGTKVTLADIPLVQKQPRYRYCAIGDFIADIPLVQKQPRYRYCAIGSFLADIPFVQEAATVPVLCDWELFSRYPLYSENAS